MKRKLLFSNCLLGVAILILSGIVPLEAARSAAAPNGKLITVLNPEITTKLADRVPLAPRLDTLQGKTVYLVDMNWEGFDNSSNMLEEMQSWFAQNVPGVKTVIKSKRGNYMTDDPELWKEIASSGANGVVVGAAG